MRNSSQDAGGTRGEQVAQADRAQASAFGRSPVPFWLCAHPAPSHCPQGTRGEPRGGGVFFCQTPGVTKACEC